MGIESPWHVTGVRLEAPTATVEVVAEFLGDKKCAAFDSCRMRRDAYQDEECLASEAQQDEAVEEITVEAVDPFIAAYRTCVDELLGGPQKFSLYCHPLRLHCMYL